MKNNASPNEDFRIDAIALSRQLRIETGKQLAGLSHAERCEKLNQYIEKDPILSRFPRIKETIPNS